MDRIESREGVSLVEQLARILTQLQDEFKGLAGDGPGFDAQRWADLEIAAEKIEFAAYCIATAKPATSQPHAPLTAGPASPA